MSKTLVIYISFSGVTKKVAERVSEFLNSDILEIKPAIPYTNEDLNWNDLMSRSSKEMQDSDSRPEIEELGDISSYDIIYIGYPIWWGTYPREINTFMDKYDLAGKTIIPFCTSGGTGISKSIRDFKKFLPNSDVKEGKRLSVYDVESWIKSINI